VTLGADVALDYLRSVEDAEHTVDSVVRGHVHKFGDSRGRFRIERVEPSAQVDHGGGRLASRWVL
jgi:hypothetical protein